MFLQTFAEVVVERRGLSAWSLSDILVAVIVIAGLAAIAVVAVQAMGYTIPAWFWKILGIVAVVVVAILAIRFVLSL